MEAQALVVDRVAKGINDMTQEGGANGDINNLVSMLDCAAFLDLCKSEESAK
jgi:hypothetical protein